MPCNQLVSATAPMRPGNRRVIVRDGVARLESGALAPAGRPRPAGPTRTGQCADVGPVRAPRGAWFGLSLSVAAGASRLSARLLGLDRRRATLAVGADTDICL